MHEGLERIRDFLRQIAERYTPSANTNVGRSKRHAIVAFARDEIQHVHGCNQGSEYVRTIKSRR